MLMETLLSEIKIGRRRFFFFIRNVENMRKDCEKPPDTRRVLVGHSRDGETGMNHSCRLLARTVQSVDYIGTYS